MLQWLKRRSQAGRTAEELYGRVVAAARQPRFYRELGVADTPEGRFELVALHLFLALEAIKSETGEAEGDIMRRTIEVFVADMDDCMREMGVGDLSVPKKVRRAAAAFYERAGAYRGALLQPADDELVAALGRYVLEGRAAPAEARGLAAYARSPAAQLSGADPQHVFAARV